MSVDFVVLTGFLGSGKTSLLRDFLPSPDAADTAVVVNEAGEVGLDGALLRETGSGVPMATLSNGCVCCQMGSDLQTTVDALLWAERPGPAGPLRRIVLETSGLSKPGPVLRQLAGLAGQPLRVSVVATFDAARGMDTASFAEAAAQWAAAHRIVVTKADTVDAGRLEDASRKAAALNPVAEIVADADRGRTVVAAFAPLAGGPLCEPPDMGAVHPRILVALARPSGPLDYDDLATWLDNLAGALGDRLLRVKGLVRVAGQIRPVLVQSVGTLFSPPRLFGGAEEAPSFLVVIARDTSADEVDAIPPAGLFRINRPSGAATRQPGLLRAEAVRATL